MNLRAVLAAIGRTFLMHLIVRSMGGPSHNVQASTPTHGPREISETVSSDIQLYDRWVFEKELYGNRMSQPRPILSTTKRTAFNAKIGCRVYGYPSSGGILIKEEPDLVDMLFLALPRFAASQRSPNAEEENAFCELMHRIGATWWPDEYEALDARRRAWEHGDARDRKIMLFGWPADGAGVWILRFQKVQDLPRDFGKLRYAMSMEERIGVMKEYGAEFVQDPTQVEELRPHQSLLSL